MAGTAGALRRNAAPMVAALVSALAVAVSPAPASSKAEQALDLRYGIYFGGFRVADAALRYEEAAGEDGPERYSSEFTTRTRGLADLLTRYEGRSTAEGLRAASAEGLAPLSYHYRRSNRDGTRSTDMTFDAEDGGVVDLELRKRGKTQRSDVPPELWLDVVDPLSAIFVVRQRTAEALAGNGPERFGVGVFDGKRRYDIDAELLGRTTATLGGEERPVVEVKLTTTALAGFDPEDEAYLGAPGAYVVARFSDDDRLVPLHVQSHGTPITAVVRLVEDCSSGDGCAAVATN